MGEAEAHPCLLRAGDYCSRAPGEVHEATTQEGVTALVIYSPA